MTLTIQSHEVARPRRYFSFLICLLFCTSSSFSQSPQPAPVSTDPTISVTSELVALPVRVTDAKGNFVPGLRQEDFQVFEDGRPQRLTLFQHEDAPVTAGLVVDHSRSMGPKLPAVAAAVYAFSHSSNPKDEMFVVDFNDDVWLQILGGKPFTSDASQLSKAISDVAARGRTALYDALAEGLNHLRSGHWEKKALIIVSDGGDNASHVKFSQVLALAQHSQVLIYSIVLVSGNAEENPRALKRLCKSTGGICYFPGLSDSIIAVSNQIARDLREQYTHGFAPEKQAYHAAFRKIQVKVSVPGQSKLTVRYRPGYFAADEKQARAATGKGRP